MNINRYVIFFLLLTPNVSFASVGGIQFSFDALNLMGVNIQVPYDDGSRAIEIYQGYSFPLLPNTSDNYGVQVIKYKHPEHSSSSFTTIGYRYGHASFLGNEYKASYITVGYGYEKQLGLNLMFAAQGKVGFAFDYQQVSGSANARQMLSIGMRFGYQF